MTTAKMVRELRLQRRREILSGPYKQRQTGTLLGSDTHQLGPAGPVRKAGPKTVRTKRSRACTERPFPARRPSSEPLFRDTFSSTGSAARLAQTQRRAISLGRGRVSSRGSRLGQRPATAALARSALERGTKQSVAAPSWQAVLAALWPPVLQGWRRLNVQDEAAVPSGSSRAASFARVPSPLAGSTCRAHSPLLPLPLCHAGIKPLPGSREPKPSAGRCLEGGQTPTLKIAPALAVEALSAHGRRGTAAVEGQGRHPGAGRTGNLDSRGGGGLVCRTSTPARIPRSLTLADREDRLGKEVSSLSDTRGAAHSHSAGSCQLHQGRPTQEAS